MKQIPAPFFSGRTFWAVVKETDTLKNDLAAFKELYLLRHRNKSLQDFRYAPPGLTDAVRSRA